MKDVFISGWYGYPELFGDFASEFEFVVPFITHSLQDINELLKEGGRNLFAWSTGAYLMLDQRKRPNFENIVLISPFKKFTDYTPERVLDKMIKKFVNFPEDVANDFLKRCGCDITPNYKHPHFYIWLNGLRFLIRTEIDEIEWSLEDVTLLHGKDDKIVSVQSSTDIAWDSGCRLIEIEGAGHFIEPETLRKYKI